MSKAESEKAKKPAKPKAKKGATKKSPAKKPANKKAAKKAPEKTAAKKEAEVVVLNEHTKSPLRVYIETYWYAVVMLIALVAFVILYVVWTPSPAIAPVQTTDEEAVTDEVVMVEPVTELPRYTDGVLVPVDEAMQPAVCVMIENAAFGGVRPQAGLTEASIVYEVIVEGGITRFMAVFPTDGDNVRIGPVRSARDTYLEFASELDCAYVHAGGSFTAMQAIPRFELKDIDALREGAWFNRRSDKVSPHNLFTDRDNLREAVIDGHSWTDPVNVETWNFVDEADTGTPHGQIRIEIGGAYNAEYSYNAVEEAYERSNTGILFTDENTGRAILAKNIIIERVPPGVLLPEKGRINFDVNGEGEAYIFRNGLQVNGTWKKDGRTSRTHYFDADGNEIPLERGQTWVHIVPEGYGVFAD